MRARIGVSSLLQRLNQVLAPIVVFFSATQFAKHFWPSFSFVRGIRVDYLSPTFGLFDFLLIIFIITTPKDYLSTLIKRLSPVILFISLTLLTTPFPWPTFNYSVHLILYLIGASLLATYYKHQLTKPLILTLAFQTILSFSQVLSGEAGFFYWLGERRLSVTSLGVAKTSLLHHFTLRAYGTFSHPNALAGWSLVSLFLIFQLSSTRLYKFIATSLVLIILFLTQSRLAFFVFYFWLYFISHFFSSKMKLSFIFFTLFLFIFFQPDFRSLALSTRISLLFVSGRLIYQFPLFGTGPGASLAAYNKLSPFPVLLQPDHNSFTLLLSWFGFYGLVNSYLFLKFFIVHLPKNKLSKLTPLLILALFDHYFLTSPQGLFIIILFLAYEFNTN